MTTKNARDFLDKELFVNRTIVTFRSLSRELNIHVNDAKKELQLYHDAVRETDMAAVPTYLVSGEVPALKVTPRLETETSMDVDLEFEEDREAVDVVHRSKVMLVDARELDETKAQFSRIYSVHVYSLSPSRLVDPGLVCVPRRKVQHADVKGGPASFAMVGKVTGTHVKLRSGVTRQSMATSSKTTLDMPARAAPKANVDLQTTKAKVATSETKGQTSATTTLRRVGSIDRPKPSGKLDWSKAKTKDKEPVTEKKVEDKKPKAEPVSTIITSTKKNLGSEPTKPSAQPSGDAQQRGIKRKPRIDTESESEPSSVNAKPSGSSVKVDSDDDDDDDDDGGAVRMLGQRRPKRKSNVTSDSEMSLRAMMDIDDDQVDCVRVSKVRPQPDEELSEEEEEEEKANETEKSATAPPMTSDGEESDDVPVVRKKARKPRKVVPVGRNGLKKRRVVKSRMTTDAKGYMQTEDYSSYESVEEEEAETKPKGKGKETRKVKEVKEAKPKVEAKEESVGKAKVKAAPRPKGGLPKRGSLLNFFGPERAKK